MATTIGIGTGMLILCSAAAQALDAQALRAQAAAIFGPLP